MVDALSTIKTVLTNNWISSNCDSITPDINYAFEKKLLSLADNDQIILYELENSIDPFGIGGIEYADLNTVSIDIRTTNKRSEINTIRAHLIKLKDEVLRIIKANLSNPDSDYCLAVLRRKKDLSDRGNGVGRMVIDVQLRRYA